MTSVTAAIGHSKDDRDYLGRWLATGRLAWQSTLVRRGRWCTGYRSRFAASCSREGQPYTEEEAFSALKNFVNRERQVPS